MKNTNNFLIIPLLLCLIYLTSTTTLFANATSLSVNPSSIFINTNNNTTRIQSIILSNNSGVDQAFSLEKKSFDIMSDGKVLIKDLTKKELANLNEQITLLDGDTTVDTISINQFSSKNIKLILNSANKSIHREIKFGLLFRPIENIEKQESTNQNIRAVSKIKAGIFIPIVASSQVSTVLISKIESSLISIDSNPSVKIIYTNESKYPLSVNADLKIKNILGKTIYEESLDNKILLGSESKENTKRVYEQRTRSELNTGLYELSLSNDVFGAGKVVIEKKYIFILNLKESITILIGLIFVTLIVRRLKKLRVNI